MGMVLFIVGSVLIIGGLALGLPLMWRDAITLGGGLAIMISSGVVGLAGAVVGLMMGKSKPKPAPAPPPVPVAAPPPPPPPQGILCPTCNRRLPPGVNRCPFCHPPVPVAAPPPPPPPPVEAGPATRGRGAVAGPNGYLQILEGPAAGKQLAIKPNMQITIGRAEENFLMIPDAEVSGRHCVLDCANDRIDFTDLGSSNGSFLNDQPFRQGRINSGDTLRLGRTTKIYFSFK